MKINITIIFLLLISIIVDGQKSIYNTYPFCNTTDYLKKVIPIGNKNSKSTVYIFHFIPNGCPRCEAPMINIFKELKDTNSIKVICLESKDYKYGVEFIKSNLSEFEKYCIIDSSLIMRKIIDHSTTNLSVPYLYKIDTKNLSILTIEPILGIKNVQSFIHKVLDDTTNVKCVEKKEKKENITENSYKKQFLIDSKQYILDDFSQFKIINSKIFILEYLTNNILIFDLEGNLLQRITKDNTELSRFISVTDTSEFNNFKRIGLAKNIYLDVIINSQNNKLLISNSLPEIKMTVSNNFNDTNVSYLNKPTLTFKTFDNKYISSHSFKLKDTLDELTTSHASIFPIEEKFAMPIYKGFPVIGASEEDLDRENFNPFIDIFYNYTPVFELCDTLNSYGYFGTLPNIYKKYKLGYYYNNTKLFNSYNYTIQYELFSGDINIYKNQNFNNSAFSFCVFPNKIDNVKTKKIKDFETKLDYLNSYREDMFMSYIYECKVFENSIHVLFKNNNCIVYNKYDLTGKLKFQKKYNIKNFDLIKSSRFLIIKNKLSIITLEKRIDNKFYLNYL